MVSRTSRAKASHVEQQICRSRRCGKYWLRRVLRQRRWLTFGIDDTIRTLARQTSTRHLRAHPGGVLDGEATTAIRAIRMTRTARSTEVGQREELIERGVTEMEVEEMVERKRV